MERRITPERLESDLLELRDQLRTLRSQVTGLDARRLLEANEAIANASQRAETIAESALASLAELTESSHRDPLTETPSRVVFFDRVERAVALARRTGIQFAVLSLDVDRFARINETYGRGVGDSVLRYVANTLRDAVRDADTVSRLGNDNFAVLLHAMAKHGAAGGTARLLRRVLQQPFVVDGQRLSLTVSLGVAMYPHDGLDPHTLVAKAASAMAELRSKSRSASKLRPPQPKVVRPVGGRTLAVGTIRVPAAPSTPILDPSDLREANQRLVLAALASQEEGKAAMDMYRRQAKTIAVVAHELRVPLHPLRMAAALLRRATGDEAMLDRIKQIIDRQVTHMARLVDDLLDGSRVDVGTLRLEVSLVDLVELLDGALETCRSLLQERGQNVVLDVSSEPLLIRGDAMRLNQVVLNLLDNSSKYSHQGGSIRVSLHKVEGDARLAVSDDGIGIEPDILPSIFDFFVQDPKAFAHARAGLGIGLGVVRELVLAHGGHVTATSQGPGSGSEFVVTLPLAEHTPEPGAGDA
ncbi:MAG: diguanylate cyclase [Planctomycetaceae bacterium]|nr:diguanylate cyclase [Planctomycetaceae bacterium]